MTKLFSCREAQQKAKHWDNRDPKGLIGFAKKQNYKALWPVIETKINSMDIPPEEKTKFLGMVPKEQKRMKNNKCAKKNKSVKNRMPNLFGKRRR